MTKKFPIASIAFLLAFALASGIAEAGPGGLANRGHGGPGLQLPTGGPGGGPANHRPDLSGPQGDGPLSGLKKDGPTAKPGNRTNGGGNTYSGGTATGTATGTYAGGNAATVSGNTVSGNTTGSNNTVNVTGNQANGTGYAYPYAAPVVVVPTTGNASAATSGTSSTATAASCPAGTTMQSVTSTAQGQTTVVCVASK